MLQTVAHSLPVGNTPRFHLETSPHTIWNMSDPKASAARVGARIRAIREQREMSMRELAARAYISYGYLRGIEVGAKAVSRIDLIDSIAEALGVTRDDLLGSSEPQVVSPVREATRILEEAARGVQGVPIPLIGVVPADVVRWANWEASVMRTIDVPLAWIGSRSAENLFIVVASGDCLMRRGIIHGTHVLCERAQGRVPRDKQIVVVRVGNEVTMKVWRTIDDRIELHDGEGVVVIRLDTLTDVVVEGMFVKAWLDEDPGSA